MKTENIHGFSNFTRIFCFKDYSLSRTLVQPIYGSSPLFAIMAAAVFGDKDRIQLAYVNQNYY